MPPNQRGQLMRQSLERCGTIVLDYQGPRGVPMVLHVEIEQEADGRWIAEVSDLPGVMAYGVSRPDAVARVQALALRSLADRLEHGEAVPELLQVAFQAA